MEMDGGSNLRFCNHVFANAGWFKICFINHWEANMREATGHKATKLLSRWFMVSKILLIPPLPVMMIPIDMAMDQYLLIPFNTIFSGMNIHLPAILM
jgi:hypothetical protein